MRDSIGSKLLPVEDDDLFITEKRIHHFCSIQPLTENKHTKRVELGSNQRVYGGTFINYAVKDENNRWVILKDGRMRRQSENATSNLN